jgi:hypothetical protein
MDRWAISTDAPSPKANCTTLIVEPTSNILADVLPPAHRLPTPPTLQENRGPPPPLLPDLLQPHQVHLLPPPSRLTKIAMTMVTVIPHKIWVINQLGRFKKTSHPSDLSLCRTLLDTPSPTSELTNVLLQVSYLTESEAHPLAKYLNRR